MSNNLINAFCVDLEEWFHICGTSTPYDDPTTWDAAPQHVIKDTRKILDLLDDAGVKGTFLTVGWIAEKYPELIGEICSKGHEIGCHTYFHRLLYKMAPDDFRVDLERCIDVLNRVSGQDIKIFRAPGFSMTKDCAWAYPILREFGIDTDISIVPAVRDHGGINKFPRDPFQIKMDAGSISVFPVSVYRFANKTVPFSGGGYLRLFPIPLIKMGFEQNLDEDRPCMLYIHPREVNVEQPRLDLPAKKYFKYYVGLRTVETKLAKLLQMYPFSTVSNSLLQMTPLPVRSLSEVFDG